MHKRLALLTFLFALACWAAPVDLNGTFQNPDSTGVPRGWMRNSWPGYNPPCTLVVVPGGGKEGNSLLMKDIQSNRGAAFNTVFHPGRCGDLLRLKFRARGRGTASVILYFQTLEGEWNFQSPQMEKFTVDDEWRNYNLALKVFNGKAGETGSFDISFEMEQGGELELSDLQVDQESSPYQGSEPFPERWTLFGPVDEEYMPPLQGLTDVPETLDGQEGRLFRLTNHTLDFAKVFGPGEKKVGWAFAVLDSPIDCGYSIGAAADWWMEFYVNGEKVLDTMSLGNVEYPFNIWNHVANVRLRKGKNLLAVKVKTGSTSSVLMMGGPLELADRTVKLKLSKMEWIESFDGESLECTGDPERIQGYPTPGLLTLTGQAVFHTADSLEIRPVADAAYPVPREKAFYRALGVRIQEFGAAAASLSLDLADAAENFPDPSRLSMKVLSPANSQELQVQVLLDGQVVEEHPFSRHSLPADFLFGVNAAGSFSANVNSLSDGSQLAFSGEVPFGQEPEAAILPSLCLAAESPDGNAQVTVDNFAVGLAVEKGAASPVPYKVEPRKEFDPVKAGWKLVFADEFDGEALDETAWSHGWKSLPENVTVHDGVLEIKTDWDAEHKTLRTADIRTTQFFRYGYFEARCTFRQEPGWWSAFWLYGASNANPFYDGFEIDIYEDYYLTRPGPDGKPYPGSPAFRGTLDHNLHVYCGETLKSWNYGSPKEDFLDGFHRIGVIWTPFEISYYLDGKLISSSANHSPYDSVTFDAFNHACGFSPLQAILSGQVKPSAGRPEYGNYPESFLTDYVRVYALPESEFPKVEWVEKPHHSQAKYGDVLSFSARAEAAPDSPIMAAYLFDGGYLLDYKTEPPFDFQVSLTREFYDVTDYNRPGRQSIVPKFDENFHCYSVFVQDEKGRVAHTEPHIITNIIPTTDGKTSTPFQGVPQEIPGILRMGDFDEGGQKVAYLDTTPGNTAQKSNPTRNEDVDVSTDGVIGYVQMGEWVKYTVNIQEAGAYTATLRYGTPIPYEENVFLYLDEQDECLGVFTLQSHGAKGHTVDKEATVTLNLPEGRHVLKVVFLAAANVKDLEFQKITE